MEGSPRRILAALRHPLAAVAVWIVVAVAALPFAATVTRHLQAENLQVSGSSSVWADNRLSLLRPPAEAGPTLLEGLSAARLRAAAAGAGVPAAWLHPAAGGLLLLPPPATPAAMVSPLLTRIRHDGGSARTVGAAAIGKEISTDSERTLHSSSRIALPLLLVLLPVVFGAIAQSVLPLVVAAVGAELALAVLSILERHIALSVYLTDIVSFLALGVGVDYALFVTSRFRDALQRGAAVSAAVREAMRTAGRSVLFSGLAVSLAMATLLLEGTSYWRGLALGGSVAVACVLLATHTLLPALLRLMGTRVRWGPIPLAMERWSLWGRLAHWSTWRPWLSVGVGLALLAVPAALAPGLRLTLPADLAVMLPRKSALRKASRLQQRLEGPGSIAPMPIALEFRTTVSDPSTWAAVARLSRDLSRLPDVSGVVSPTWSGTPPAELAIAAAALGEAEPRGPLAAFINPGADPHLVAISVTASSGPDQPATRQLLSAIDATLGRDLPAGARGAVGGTVALLHDFNRHSDSRLPWVVGAAALVALVVLFVATGSLPEALLGVALDGVVAAATAGVLVLTIQRGLFGLDPQPPNLTVTPLVFVLLFGLSMDYEVILLHRIQEGLRAGSEVRAAARRGIAETGGMITGAGLVMVVVFIVLLTSPLEVLQTLAIGMTAAILLDTWIVRTFLIPGITALMGRWAFWPWGGGCSRGAGAG
jgi:RND superfamily putative drug exporter